MVSDSSTNNEMMDKCYFEMKVENVFYLPERQTKAKLAIVGTLVRGRPLFGTEVYIRNPDCNFIIEDKVYGSETNYIDPTAIVLYLEKATKNLVKPMALIYGFISQC